MSLPETENLVGALDERSLYLRRLIVDALAGAGKGHVGPSLSLVEILRVLYDDFMAHRPSDPKWSGRDRLILSKGHGALALYALLADHGYFDINELALNTGANALLGGHPESPDIPGVEASTGSLGHGVSLGVGMALALRTQASSSRVVVVTGDGELNEGSIWEGAAAAARHELTNLIVVVDHNRMQCHGELDVVSGFTDIAAKFSAFGFSAVEIDGHDIAALRSSFDDARRAHKPTAVVCRTVKGKGLSFAENNPAWHYSGAVTHEIASQMRAELHRAS